MTTVKSVFSEKRLQLHERHLFKTTVSNGLALKDDIDQVVASLDKYRTPWRIRKHGNRFFIVRTTLT